MMVFSQQENDRKNREINNIIKRTKILRGETKEILIKLNQNRIEEQNIIQERIINWTEKLYERHLDEDRKTKLQPVEVKNFFTKLKNIFG